MSRSDEAMLGPGTVSWKINREATLMAGGGRALLLQVGHPLVAAGVAQHSNYQAEPWQRLYRTMDTMVKIAFGDKETSAGASITEKHLLELELEAFVSLCGEPKTQDRLMAMLETGKPLRN